MSKKNDISLILNEIKRFYRFRSNIDFASFLGIAPQTLSSWYSRNSIDYELVYSKCVEIDGNWLLSGTGDMLRHNDDGPVPCGQDSLKEIINIKDKRIDELNREAGKLEYQLAEMRKKLRRLKKGEYEEDLPSHSVAAEDKLSYSKTKKALRTHLK